MADNISKGTDPDQTIPHFYFKVDFGNEMGTGTFQEVSGLDAEAQTANYRHGDTSKFSAVKMPGVEKYANVTLRKGIMKKDQRVFTWFNQIKMNSIKRSTVTISLLDENNSAVMIWTLKNAFPTKMTHTDLKTKGKEMAVESIDIAFEEIEMKKLM